MPRRLKTLTAKTAKLICGKPHHRQRHTAMKKIVSAAMALFAIATQSSGAASQDSQAGNAHQFEFTAINGKPMPLSQYSGKVLLVVNTASECGFTPQYEGLQALWQKYREQGLVVIGVPSNDFGGQEPGNAEQIQGFCKGQYGVTFPLTEKYPVKGVAAHPFYKWAESIAGKKNTPMWNFHKYLIGRDGRLLAWFPTATAPGSKLVTQAIESELAKADS
jgi:glutathione peroxidase